VRYSTLGGRECQARGSSPPCSRCRDLRRGCPARGLGCRPTGRIAQGWDVRRWTIKSRMRLWMLMIRRFQSIRGLLGST